MPIYEFRCRSCDTLFEAIRPLGDSGESLSCPNCGTARPEKQISVFSASTPARGGGASLGCGTGFT